MNSMNVADLSNFLDLDWKKLDKWENIAIAQGIYYSLNM